MKTQSAKLLLAAVLFSGVSIVPCTSSGWSFPDPGYVQGTIGAITVVSWGFYFSLEGGDNLCTKANGGLNRGVVNTTALASEESRKAMLHLLTTAWRNKATVRVYANDNTTWGCLVGALTML